MNQEDVEEVWRKIQEEQDSLEAWSSNYFESHKVYYRGILGLVDEHLTEPLLEVGSAPFHLTSLLQKLGYKIAGLDLDPGRMDELIESLELDIRQCDIERDSFPIDDNSVSGVVFTEVLEHLRIDPIHTLEEINRVLKPKGKLLLTTPNLISIYNIHSYLTSGKITDPYDEFIKLREVGHMGHIREYTASEVSSLLEKTGFETISQKYANWENKDLGERSILHSIGVLVSWMLPKIQRFQIHIAEKNETV